jgi:hypothetical protein
MAVATGAVHKGGAWFKFGEHQWQGQPNVVKAIKEDANLEAMQLKRSLALALNGGEVE